MLDIIRNLTKSEADKHQEMITAYLDSALSPGEQHHFEQLLADDPALRASVEKQRLIKQQLRKLPRVPAPRNFTLDPTLYGRPQPQTSSRLYPYVRFATAIAGILLVVFLATDLLLISTEPNASPAEAPVALELQESAADQAPKEMTRVVEEEVAMAGEEAAVEMPEAAGEADLSVLATEPVAGEPQPTASPPGTIDAFEASRQAEATSVAQTDAVAEDEALAVTGPPITSTDIQGPQTESFAESAPDLEDGDQDTVSVGALRLIEIGLLVTVILLVALSLYLRRQL